MCICILSIHILTYILSNQPIYSSLHTSISIYASINRINLQDPVVSVLLQEHGSLRRENRRLHRRLQGRTDEEFFIPYLP